MYVIIELGTGNILVDSNGDAYTFQHLDNALEVAQDLSADNPDGHVTHIPMPLMAH